MRNEQKLYEYMYQALTSQILNGVFLPGHRFPSQREICQRYNVGITTVRKVMGMLAEDGYISTAQGQPTMVTYQASTDGYIRLSVQRRDEIADAYKGLRHLMPALYREGAKQCGAPQIQALQTIADAVRPDMELDDLFSQANTFFTALVRPLNNQLIMDLELDSESYLHVPYIPISGAKPPIDLTGKKLKVWMEHAIIQIREKQLDDFYKSTVSIYIRTAKSVDDYLQALSLDTSSQNQIKRDIRWFHTKSRGELYVNLARTIIHRIIDGEFDGQAYLPSIPKLMEEYGVMKDTASRAVELLSALGFVRTIDKKGTVIASDGVVHIKNDIDFTRPVIMERLFLVQDAFQIIALTARDCAASFSSVPDNMAASLESAFCVLNDGWPRPLSFQMLMDYYIQLVPYHSLKNILSQLAELLLWGYYLKAVDNSCYPDPGNMAAAMKDVLSAMKNHGALSLPKAFENAFGQIYQDISAVISQLPGHDKKRI